MTHVRFAALMLMCAAFAGCGGNSNSGNGGGGGGNGSPTTVTVKFTGGMPLAVATQIGSGSFAPTTATSNAVTLTVPAGTDKFAIAYVCQTVNGFGSSQSTYTFQNVIEASTLDGNSFTQGCGSITPSGNTGTLTGSVDSSAISGVNYIGVTADNGSGGSQGAFLSGASTNFSLTMPAGTDSVSVGGYVFSSGNQLGTNSTWTLAAIRNFTGVAVPGPVNGGGTITLGASDAVVPQLITYNNVPSGYPATNTTGFYVWKSGGAVWLSNALSSRYPAVPASATRSGDFYSFQSSAQISLPSGVFQQVGEGINTTSNGPLTITFPDPWNYAGPTPAAQPVFDIGGLGLNGKAGVAITGEMVWNVGTTGTVETSVTATSNHLKGATSLSFPPLSGLTGFSVPPTSGTLVVWFVGATQSSAGALQPIGQSGTLSEVANSGTFTVP